MNRNPDTRAGPFEYEPPPLEVHARAENESTFVVELRGELDLATGSLLHKQLEPFVKEIADGAQRRIVYHLSDLTFMDCSGLNALLNAVDGHAPKAIGIRDPSPLVRRVLDLLGMASMVDETEQ